jgi:hypothetical protein
MSLDFVLLACGTPLDVVGDPFIHFPPLIEFLDFSDHFILSQMSGCGVVMGSLQDVL